jgi:SH3-like domain-containing protein
MLAALAVAVLAQGVVVMPVANMYSKPTLETDVVSQAIYGTPVGVLEEQAGWAKVRTPDDYTGWLPDGAFRKLGEGERAYASSGRVAMVESMFAHLYREPDVTTFAPVLTVPFETRLEITEEPKDNSRWLRASLAGGKTAWVQRGDVTFDTAPLAVDAAIALAKRFLGLPYTWGGTSSYGYDCSGFAQMIYRRMGVLLPRDAGPQAEWSGFVPVKRSNLRPGDLLYFGPSEQHITHTGIYIGRGEFINATTHEHPVIRIDKLGEPHWAKLLVAARRLK